jgi:ubiquinol-cytochrome c reductase iron-sulfur subunit
MIDKITSEHSTDSGGTRLLVLRVLVKLMLLLALLVCLWVMLQAMSDGRDSSADRTVASTFEIGDIEPGGSRLLDWNGRPVVVLRRPPEWQAFLREANPSLLLDPESNQSKQPDFAVNVWRSNSPEWFVAIALGTDLGCTLNFLPPSHLLYQRERWRGGFADTCRGSRYDLAGRVFQGPFATANLTVPDWTVDTATRTLVLRDSQ